MANLIKWAAGTGQGLTYGAAFGTEINSLAAGSVAVSTVAIVNSSALDMFADISFSVTGTTPSTGSPYLAFYLMPLNQDGTTYGDGTASGTVAPLAGYIGSAQLPLGKTSTTLVGTLRGIVLPPRNFKFAVVNLTSNALSASGNTISWASYVENTAG